MNRKILITLISITALLAFIVFWVLQRNIYSKEILKLEILGPEKVQAGEEIEYTLKYRNNGNTVLEEAELVFEYPHGSFVVEQDSDRVVQDLEDIYPGQEEVLKFKGKLFGKEGDIKTASVVLNYRAEGLKPFYESKSSFSSEIQEVPISFDFDFPSKAVLNKESRFSLNYFSNLDSSISDLRIKLNYPSGFEFVSSNVLGIDNEEWKIDSLAKAEGGRIEINGKISGRANQEKKFKAELGIWVNDQFISLKEIDKTIQIIEPRLSISQRINNSLDYTAEPGELLHYEITYRNVGEQSFEDLFLISKLDGPLDFDSLSANGGEINLSEKTILWDWRDFSSLKNLQPGQEGKIEFWVRVKESWEGDPVIKNKISLSEIKQEFSTKVKSNLIISQKGYFNDEVFGNSGEIPPKIGKETTYTISWDVKNYQNKIKNTKVRAVLPEEIELTGEIYPESEKNKFTFDSDSREIVWSIGDLSENESKLISFQIKFIPVASQKGIVVNLIGQAEVVGEDQWAETSSSSVSAAVNTSLPDDPSVNYGQGVVQ